MPSSLIACGLSVVGAGESGGSPSTTGEAGVDSSAPDPQRDGSPSLVGGDDGGDRCVTVIDDDFGTRRMEWDTLGLRGGPVFGRNIVTLTPGDAYGVQGAIWWKAPINLASSLEIDVTYGWT